MTLRKTSLSRTGLWVATLIATVLCPMLSAGPQNAREPGDEEPGRQLYFDFACYSCHGYNGETGRKLIGSPILESEAGFIRFLRLRGDQNPLLPSTRMPNFPENSLSDAQARDIYAYIRTFRGDDPPLADIPTLNAIIEAASRPYEP